MGKGTVFLIFLGIFLAVVLSSPTPRPNRHAFSRRVTTPSRTFSRSPANLRLQTLRSSRQVLGKSPSIPALYSAPKEKEKEEKAEPSSAYGPPSSEDDATAATTETVTEETLESASTTAPDAEIVEDNEAQGTERTSEYLPPPGQEQGQGKPIRDQQMIETTPFHQIQIHVVPPHLSQGDNNNDILRPSYGGVPLMQSIQEMYRQMEASVGQYLPPQSRQHETDLFENQGQLEEMSQEQLQNLQGYSGEREQQQQQQPSGESSPEPPSREFEIPQRGGQEQQQQQQGQQQEGRINQGQIYNVPASYSYTASTGGMMVALERANSNRPQEYGVTNSLQQQPQNEQRGQEEYAPIQYLPQPQQSQPQQQFSNDQQGYQNFGQRQQSPQNQGYSQSPQGYYQQPSSQPQGYGPPQQNPQDSQNDAVIIEAQGRQNFPQNQERSFNKPNEQLQSSQNAFQGYQHQQQQQSYEQPQQNYPTQQSSGGYNFPQPAATPQQGYSSSPRENNGYSQRNQFTQPEPVPFNDQQSLTSNSDFNNQQQSQGGGGYQQNEQSFRGQGSPQPQGQQQQQPINPSQNQNAYSFPSNNNNNVYSQQQQQSQSQIRHNSVDNNAQEEELEGLNGSIVDAALLLKVQQIIDEHERRQKAFLDKFSSSNSNPISSGGYGEPLALAPAPLPQQNPQPAPATQQGYDQQSQQTFGQAVMMMMPGGYQSESPLTGNVQYQRAILSHQFTETEPIISNNANSNNGQNQQNTQEIDQGYSSSQHQGQSQGYSEQSPSPQRTEGLIREIPAPQFGTRIPTPKPVYGVPLAPVIGLDSNENFKVVDENASQKSYGTPLRNNYLNQQPQSNYGRNRRRVRKARVVKIINPSTRLTIPSFSF